MLQDYNITDIITKLHVLSRNRQTKYYFTRCHHGEVNRYVTSLSNLKSPYAYKQGWDGARWNLLPSDTDFTFRIRMDSTADLPRSVDSVFNTHHCRLFDMLNLIFDAVSGCVSVFVVYRFVLSCRPDTRNNLIFCNAKPNSNSTKNCLCTSDGFRCGKIIRFQQHSNLNSVTPLHKWTEPSYTE